MTRKETDALTAEIQGIGSLRFGCCRRLHLGPGHGAGLGSSRNGRDRRDRDGEHPPRCGAPTAHE